MMVSIAKRPVERVRVRLTLTLTLSIAKRPVEIEHINVVLPYCWRGTEDTNAAPADTFCIHHNAVKSDMSMDD